MNRVTLPHDDGFLPEQPTQWWYWTGHLATPDGRRFGFEVCFFAFHVDVALGRLIGSHLGREGIIDRLTDYAGFQMVHTALSDVQQQRYRHASAFKPDRPATLEGAFELSSGHPCPDVIVATGGAGKDALRVAMTDWGLDLSLVNDDAANPPMLQYGGNCHLYTFGGYTYYYSRPLMRATGTVQLGGQAWPVTGTVWFDRQYGELNQVVYNGWQWFALQFTDGRQAMVFDITNHAEERYGSICGPGGREILPPSSVGVHVLDHWTSPHSGIVYPSKWQVSLGREIVTVTPLIADQEVSEPWPLPSYWEGDSLMISADGSQIGQAYVELSGFKKP